MKKASVWMAIITICFMSCTSIKKSTGKISVQDYYKDNPYAQKYMGTDFLPYLITKQQAMVYIHAFKKHNYRVTRKKKLDTAWSTFNRKLLDSLTRDSNTASLFFLMAAYPKWDKTIDKEFKRHPFIIMQGIPKPDSSGSGKGGVSSLKDFSQSLYLSPIKICPPPNTGCRIPGS